MVIGDSRLLSGNTEHALEPAGVRLCGPEQVSVKQPDHHSEGRSQRVGPPQAPQERCGRTRDGGKSRPSTSERPRGGVQAHHRREGVRGRPRTRDRAGDHEARRHPDRGWPDPASAGTARRSRSAPIRWSTSSRETTSSGPPASTAGCRRGRWSGAGARSSLLRQQYPRVDHGPDLGLGGVQGFSAPAWLEPRVYRPARAHPARVSGDGA